MKLFKNVNICDIESILSNGLLSLDECGNNHWESGKRVANPTDVVYLAAPLTQFNSFVNYGAALVEVSVPDERVRETQIADNDVNKGKYREFVTDRITPDDIVAIYIPEEFKQYVNISESVIGRITWCKMSAQYVSGTKGTGKFFIGIEELETVYSDCSSEMIERFSATAELNCSSDFNYFRGVNADGSMLDIYNVSYDI